MRNERKQMALITNTQNVVIQTVAPNNLTIGEIQLKADRRDSKEKTWSAEEKIRRIVLPTGFWGELTANLNGEKSQGLTDILRNAIIELGNARLKDALEENPMIRELPLADFSVASLLAWSEETAASRGSMTFKREQAEKWFADSKTKANALQRWQEAGDNEKTIKAKTDFLSNRFGALAAKNHGLADLAAVDKLLALIDPSDCESGIGADILGRIAHIQKSMQAKKNEEAISMDAL